MEKMTDSRAVEVLAAHNAWRLGGDGPATDPTTLGLAIDHAIARLREPARVPEGWVLVPRKPTPDMVCAGFLSKPDPSGIRVDEPMDAPSMVWRAMLRAAPQPPAPELSSGDKRLISPVKPPAEAQAQGGGEVVVQRLRGVLKHAKMGNSYLIPSDLIHKAIEAITAPPSAPVGVEE